MISGDFSRDRTLFSEFAVICLHTTLNEKATAEMNSNPLVKREETTRILRTSTSIEGDESLA
jgi:hypothetical protein